VTLGASITEGHVTTQNTNRRWPNLLFQRLQSAQEPVAVLNLAISGNRLITGGAGPTSEDRFERDVLRQPGVQWVIFADAPVNDLNSADPPSADVLIAAMRRLIDRAHRQNIRFLCSTLTPFEGTKEWTPQREAERQQVNNFLRSTSSGCDGLVDQDVATHDPAHPTRFLPAFDHGDHLHPNEAGMQAIASAVDLRIFQTGKASEKH
jgi:lysophospholipase L1-like esterase